MKSKNTFCPELKDLRKWVLSQNQNAAVVKFLIEVLRQPQTTNSQKSRESLWDLLLNLPHSEFEVSKIILDRIEREAWDELIPEIPQIVEWIEIGQFYKESDQLLPSNFAASFELGDQVFERDLRGIECPRNFVKASVILKRLRPGSILELNLDQGQPIENVPMRLKGEGYLILERTKVQGTYSETEDYWRIRVKKPD